MKELKNEITNAIDMIRPEAGAEERILQKAENQFAAKTAPKKKSLPWLRWAVPVCACGLLVAVGVTVLPRLGAGTKIQPENDPNAENQTETTVAATQPGVDIPGSGPATSEATNIELAFELSTNEMLTALGRVWHRQLTCIEPSTTVLGTVDAADFGALVGETVYATAVEKYIAVKYDGGLRIYEYYGESDGNGGVADTDMGAYLDVMDIRPDTVTRIELRDPSRDVTVEHDGLTSFTPFRRTITDPAAIEALLNQLRPLERDGKGYRDATADAQNTKPYEGYLSVAIWTNVGEPVYVNAYPKINFIFGGWKTTDALWSVLHTLDATN